MVIPVCCVTANPPHLNHAAVYYLVEQPYGNLIFRGKCFFFRNMAFFVKQRKIFPEPLLWKIKFIIHKAVPVVPGKSKEYAGLTVFCFAQTAAVLAFHSGGMFRFFTKHVSSTDSIPGTCPTCLESSPWKIHEWLFLKKEAGKELLHGADILLPGKMECNRFDGFTLQQA